MTTLPSCARICNSLHSAYRCVSHTTKARPRRLGEVSRAAAPSLRPHPPPIDATPFQSACSVVSTAVAKKENGQTSGTSTESVRGKNDRLSVTPAGGVSTSAARTMNSLHQCSHNNRPNAWCATEEDYRALIRDLLLYRVETLEPILRALQSERQTLDTNLKKLDRMVESFARIRESIRSSLLCSLHGTEEHDRIEPPAERCMPRRSRSVIRSLRRGRMRRS